MKYSESIITPKMALALLQNNNVNRHVNPGRVKQYAYDMKMGKWQLNGEAIKIYEDGSLADGQHRLQAIVACNTPIKLSVITGLPKNVTIQDRGRTRNLVDSMILEGYPKSVANKDNVAIAKLHYVVHRDLSEMSNGNISDGMTKDFILRNESNLLLVASACTIKGGAKQGRISISAPIKLAMFYAINSGACDDSALKEFASVLSSGIPTRLDQSAAIVCRNDIISGAIQIKQGGTTTRAKAVFKVEKALSDFLSGYPRKVTYGNWIEPIYSSLEVNKNA